MRILVTGSRDWSDGVTVRRAIWQATNEIYYDPKRTSSDDALTLVHGDCETGADRIANDYFESLMDNDIPGAVFKIEKYPANWSLGRSAGPERNRYMISLGADICLAFIGPCTSPRCQRYDPHPSHGASGTANMAINAGIKTVTYYANDGENAESDNTMAPVTHTT